MAWQFRRASLVDFLLLGRQGSCRRIDTRRSSPWDLHSVYSQDSGSETATILGNVLSRFPDPSWYGASFTPAERDDLLARSFQQLSPYLKGLLALTLKRMGREADARLVWESVLDRARSEPSLGTFWPPEERGWLWNNDPIEPQAAAIRTTMEVTPKSDKLDGMVE